MTNKKDEQPTFTSAQLIESGLIDAHIDVLRAVLASDKGYTVRAAKSAVEEFLKREV